MKRINPTKLMALLASLCLITSSFVGSTLAKYTTSDIGKDTARVAKFGVVVSATDDTMFSKTYEDEDANYTGLSVSSSETVVAPGTAGTLTKLSITGTPEVAVRVTNAADLELTNWDASGYYCPIVITVGTTAFNGMDYASADEFETAVEAAIAAYKEDYAPGTDLSTKTNALPVVSWAWAFEGGTGTNHNQSDANDTVLGNAGTAKINLDITTTVTQIN